MALPRTLLVVGSGGREHALVQALARSAAHPRILCAPGNAGIADEAACFPVAVDDLDGLVALARQEAVDFVVVGPEVPLSLGLIDRLMTAGIPAYGPKADGARLEASKIYTKEILLKYRIPTAPAAFFESATAAVKYVRSRPAPIVVKADGLAAGKGVVVASTPGEAEEAIHALLALPATAGPSNSKIESPKSEIDPSKSMPVSGSPNSKTQNPKSRILIEDCLTGDETSIMVVVSGCDYVILPVSQDHKRIGDGDTGPNTGGMGTYSPAEIVSADMLQRIDREIVRPSVDAIAAEGIDFRGTLFIGIMLTPAGPQVLEYNTRFGDPETQVVLPRIAGDVLDLLWRAATGSLKDMTLAVRPEVAICVVIAASGYPDKFTKGEPIGLPRELPAGISILHAGTKRGSAGELLSNGGRVLGVAALAATLTEAAQQAYAACETIEYASKYFRRDIGARQLHHP